MNGIEASARPAASSATQVDARLQRVCREMEAVFLRQLFQVMRESTQESGLMEESSGQDTFTALLDDQVASEAAQRMERGLGDALYRQISRRMALLESPASAEGKTQGHEHTTD
jgi:flagellar protein FlgJ